MKTLHRVAWVSSFIVALAACAPINPLAENQTDVRIVDTALPLHPVGWLDEETVVAIGESGEIGTERDRTRQRVLKVMTLNYRTGARQTFGEFSSSFCFVDRYLSYFHLNPSTKQLTLSYGELGKETTIKVEPGEVSTDSGPSGSCRPWNELAPLPEWTRSVATMRLWPRVGVISCNVRSYSLQNRHVPASFHTLQGAKVAQLPFSCFDIRWGFRYYAFKEAYFSAEQDLVSPWPQGRDRKVFWLYANGAVETVALPYSPFIRDTLIPTARGIVAITEPASGDANLGVYLVSDAKSKRILSGYAGGVLSPSGCRLAVLHDPDFLARLAKRQTSGTTALKILELCTAKQ